MSIYEQFKERIMESDGPLFNHKHKLSSGPPMLHLPVGTIFVNTDSAGPPSLYVQTSNTSGPMKVTPLSNPPHYCNYCGSGWHESERHPGTCGNCGGPEKDALDS